MVKKNRRGKPSCPIGSTAFILCYCKDTSTNHCAHILSRWKQHNRVISKATTDVRRVLLKDERSREKCRIDALQQMEHYWSNHIASFRSSGYGFGKRHHQRIGTRKLKVSDSKTHLRPIKKTHPKREFAHHRTKVTNQKRNLM